MAINFGAPRPSSVANAYDVHALPPTDPENLPHNLSHLHAPLLVQQQHLQRALFLGFPFLPRLYTHKIRRLRAFAAVVGYVSEGVGARREQHLADPAETGTTNGQQPQARHRT